MTAIFISFLLITLVNVLAYVWAYRNQSDHLTDISYSACFIAVAVFFFQMYGGFDPSRIILVSMVILWAIRLGGFLFYRIHKMGRDTRFDEFRASRSGFLKFWLLQSISIWIIALPVMTGLMVGNLKIIVPAIMVWAVGWLIESIADGQKFIFKSSNQGAGFIQKGLYSRIRHPNYLGEILVWIGIFWYVAPSLDGWMWWSVVSPLWVILLLLKVSGIPLIEKANEIKYKDDPAFQKYQQYSWRIIPFVY
jgi:steroid 5-alpha reductase family enzyme